jgi:hypothetical protein
MAGRPPPMSSPLMLSTAAPPDSSHARDGGSPTQPFGHVAAGRKAMKASWARPHAEMGLCRLAPTTASMGVALKTA